MIDGSWALVTDFFGTDILRTVEAGPVHIQPERIFEAWLGGKPST